MLVSREPFKIKLSFENRDRHGAGDVCDGIVNATVVSSIFLARRLVPPLNTQCFKISAESGGRKRLNEKLSEAKKTH